MLRLIRPKTVTTWATVACALRLLHMTRAKRLIVILASLQQLAACGTDVSEPIADSQTQQIPYGVILAIDPNSLPSTLPPQARIVAFARRSGETMPFVVDQHPAASVPSTLRLFNKQPIDNVEVVVRLSPTGAINKQEGDTEWRTVRPFTHPPQTLQVTLGSEAKPQKTTITNTELQVAVDADPASNLDPNTTVYVSVMAHGTLIPVAVRRITAAQLPAELTLTDADNMMPGRQLSRLAQPIVNVHASLDGTPSKSSGDWVGKGERQSDGSFVAILDKQL